MYHAIITYILDYNVRDGWCVYLRLDQALSVLSEGLNGVNR